MYLSSRVIEAQESVTLTVNDKINELSKGGKHIYNLTAGQLPFKPSSEFIKVISSQLNFLKSYQYSPIGGFVELQKKFMKYTEKRRNIKLKTSDDLKFDCVISNGAKHTLYNVLGAIVNPSDEVILLTPYWVSYPEMIKFWGGVPQYIKSNAFDGFMPYVDEIRKTISNKTKAIIINSPNNPAGIHYDDNWMKEFAVLLKEFPNIIVISDEIYSEINYFDPKPTYFYQYDESLLAQTVIVDGISKSFACTGLRIGYCIADKKLTDAVAKIQSQTTSGPNSLIQKSLLEFDFDLLDKFFDPVNVQFRESAQIVRKAFKEAKLSHCWYQTTSGFYYFIDFTRLPCFETYKEISEDADHSELIVRDILDETGVALVPGAAFGFPNSARMSMTIELAPFEEAMGKLMSFLSTKN